MRIQDAFNLTKEDIIKIYLENPVLQKELLEKSEGCFVCEDTNEGGNVPTNKKK